MIDFKEGSVEITPLNESKIEVDYPENVTNLGEFAKGIDLVLWIYGLSSGTTNHYIWLTEKQARSLFLKLGKKLVDLLNKDGIPAIHRGLTDESLSDEERMLLTLKVKK